MKGTLKDKKIINQIFSAGKTRSDELIMVKSISSDVPGILVAVSSKKFTRAVDRNRIKRLMRESLKGVVLNGKSLAVVFLGDKVPTFDDVNSSISKLI